LRDLVPAGDVIMRLIPLSVLYYASPVTVLLVSCMVADVLRLLM
jgi:hypothetical protein